MENLHLFKLKPFQVVSLSLLAYQTQDSVIAESCDDLIDCDLQEFLASNSIVIDDLAVLASIYTWRNYHGN